MEIREINKLRQEAEKEEEVGFKFITKSRRKKVDPIKAVRETSNTGRMVS